MTGSRRALRLSLSMACGMAASVALGQTPKGETRPDPRGTTSMQKDKLSTTKRAAAAGVTFEWSIDGDSLHGRMSAPTRGWVTIGFNRTQDLKGTRLVMGYVQNGKAVVEEHIADPPNHRPKEALGGKSGVSAVSGWEDAQGTTIEFNLRLTTGEPFDVPLVAGQSYYTTFAWSHEDDLYHHSAIRTAIDVTL